MEKKNLLVRIFVPVVVAGMVFVGLPACFQDDGYPEGFVLNDEAGVATMAKRSMPQGGESIKPIEPEKPSYKYGEATVTFKCTNALPSEYIIPIRWKMVNLLLLSMYILLRTILNFRLMI